MEGDKELAQRIRCNKELLEHPMFHIASTNIYNKHRDNPRITAADRRNILIKLLTNISPDCLVLSYNQATVSSDFIDKVINRLHDLNLCVMVTESSGCESLGGGHPKLLRNGEVLASGAYGYRPGGDTTPSIPQFLDAQESCPFHH